MAIPTDLAGLVGWFDAAEYVTTPGADVSSWGSRPNGTPQAAQDVSAFRPVGTSRPAVYFDGVDDFLEAPGVPFGHDSTTIFVVLSAEVMTQSQYGLNYPILSAELFDPTSSWGLEFGIRPVYAKVNDVSAYYPSAYVRFVGPTNLAIVGGAGFADRNYSYLSARVTETEVQHRLDGGSLRAASYTHNPRSTPFVTRIGSSPESPGFPGWIREAFWFDRALVDYEMASMHDYLATRYVLPNYDTTPTKPPPEPLPGDARITWDAPLSDGGLPILDYRVERQRDSGLWEVLGNPTAQEFTDLDAVGGDLYRVTARNANGYSSDVTSSPFYSNTQVL